MAKFEKGQRWISESEPELGVGVVVDTSAGRVFLLFRASETIRQYATGSAPIKRVEFTAGDTIKTHDGHSVLVESVESREGILVYRGSGREVPETDLSDTLTFSKPEDRLFAGQVDENEVFDLRLAALRRRHQIRHSAVRGLIGGRIDLIPHQLYIAQEVTSRMLPRVLLADEVGLGKTIEACLILHNLYRSGRAGRILILVPETLVHQWFVELLRRFNLRVSIYDEERCDAIETGNPDANPFLDDQVILCAIGLIAQDEKRGDQVVEAGWNLIIVDEAHHLEWSPGKVSSEYRVVEQLAENTQGVILLTATPEQLGTEGHFARLRLLDPERYSDYDHFQAERSDYQQIATVTAKLLDHKPLIEPDQETLHKLFASDLPKLDHQLAAIRKGDTTAREMLVQDLLDQHGTGRVMFRNTRAAMQGFPKRKVDLQLLPERDLADEHDADHSKDRRVYELQGDPRIDWLVTFLKNLAGAKVLLICRTREKVLALEEALRGKVNLKIALFHEELTLLQRDRNAAWFAEEEGAQILLCSEIGSEGRNFQFAHHLVLFDLPTNPELLEQRIGRLDRIGQTETISIHVPYPKNSHLELLARWFHEGLNAFERPFEGGGELLKRFGDQLAGHLHAGETTEEFEIFVQMTKEFHVELVAELEKGQDRLLQLNSCRPDVAAQIIEQIRAFDRSTEVDEFVLAMFDHYGVHVEELSNRTYLAVPANLTTDAFPELPAEGLTVTCDRTKALSREEIGFLTWDHPIVTGAIDLLVGSEQGNSAFAMWSGGEQGMYLETIFVLEAIAAPALHIDRFLPPTPIRMVVNAKGEDVTEEINPAPAELSAGSVFQLLDNGRIKRKVLPAMLAKSREHATEQAGVITLREKARMQSVLRREIERLQDLRKVNDHIREEEITLLESQMTELTARLQEAPLRLDSVRLIWRTGA